MAWFALLLDPTFLLVIAVVYLTVILWRAVQRPSDVPPGPGLALPVIGHNYLLTGKDMRMQFAKWRQQYGDIFSLFRGHKLMIVFNGYEVIHEAFVKQADMFSDRPPEEEVPLLTLSPSRGVINTSGDLWKAQRKASLEILRELGLGKNVLAEKIQEEVNEFIKELASRSGQSVDLGHLMKISVSNNICSVILGKRFQYEDADFQRCIEILELVVANSSVFSIFQSFPILRLIPGDPFKIQEIFDNKINMLDVFLKPFIDKHLQDLEKYEVSDFIAAYVRDIKNGKRRNASAYINELNLKQLSLDLFEAGTETTSTAIRWMVAYFVNYPDVEEKCFQEVDRVIGSDRDPSMRDRPKLIYLEATIMEVLRIAAFLPFAVSHAVVKDTVFKEYRIPKDAWVIPNLDSVLRDPKVWGDPDNFRPERFISPDGILLRPDEFIPFSIGRRVCLGEALARTELFLYVATMVQRFRFLPPEDGPTPSLEGVVTAAYYPKPYNVRIISRT